MSSSFYIGGVLFENGDTIATPALPVASTTQVGLVQLNDTTSSTSVTQAATANVANIVYDLVVLAQADATQALADASAAQATADAALPKSGGTMTGDITFSGTQNIPVTGIQGATTSQPGVVQLNDTISSTSTTEALTANQGKELQDQINALSVASNITLAGTIDASTGTLVTVTTEGSTAGFTIGNPLPSPAAGNDNYFVIVTVPGDMTPPGGLQQECHQGDWWLSDGSAWVFLNVGFNATAATDLTPGVVQLATDPQVQGGTNTDHAVTPSGLQSKLSDSTSTTSSTTIASSTAVKSAYDAGIQGQTDAATALAAANAAGTDVGNLASLTTTDKTSAVAAINEVNAAASAAQGDATQALSDAAAAQADATQALSDAAAAQATANAALPLAGGTMTGDIIFNAGQTFSGTLSEQDFQAKGDLVAGFGLNSFGVLSVGTNGQILSANSACVSGMEWIAAGGGGSGTVTSITAGTGLLGGTITGSGTISLDTTCVIQPSALTGKGALITASASSTPVALSVGTNGQVLTACSACASGLTWASAGGGGGGVSGVTGTAPITVDNTDPANPVVEVSASSTLAAGVVQLDDAVTSTSATTAATSNAAKTAYDAGVLGQTCAATALSVANAAIPCSALLAKGNLIVATAASTPVALPVGTDGQVLTANSACASGVAWAAAGGGGTLCGFTCVPGTGSPLNTVLGACSGLALPATITSGGGNNVVIGACSGRCLSSVSSSGNTILGFNAGGLTTSSGSVLIGSLAGCSQTTGANTLIGSQAGCRITTGSGNVVVIGASGLTTGCFNLYMLGGPSAISTACENVAIGYVAGSGITTGACNVAIGSNAGRVLSTGRCNVLIGYCAGVPSSSSFCGCVTTGSNNVVIGVCGGTTTPTSSDEVVLWNSVGGQRFIGTGNWAAVSDVRDKSCIQGLALGLNFINEVQPRQFEWDMRHTDKNKGDKAMGFVAQEVQEVVEKYDAVDYAKLVETGNENQWMVSMVQFVPVLVKAIQELSAKNEELEARLAALEG